MGASCLTSWPAGAFFDRSGVTEAISETLPSGMAAARMITPLFRRDFSVSASARSDSLSTSGTWRAISVDPAISTRSSSAAAAAAATECELGLELLDFLLQPC